MEKESNNKTIQRLRKITIVLVILICSQIVFLVWNVYSTSKEELEIEYTFSIDNPDSERYELYIPIPNIPHKLEDQNGNIEFERINTDYGEAYRINATGSMEIFITGHEKRFTIYEKEMPEEYYGFSTQNDSNDDDLITWRDEYHFWIFSDNSDDLSVSIDIELYSYDSYCGTNRHISYNGNISNGWELVEFEIRILCCDGYPASQRFVCCSIIIIPILTIAFFFFFIILIFKLIQRRRNLKNIPINKK